MSTTRTTKSTTKTPPPARMAAASDPPSTHAAAAPAGLRAGQLVTTEGGRHALVTAVTPDGPVICYLAPGTLYQLPLIPVV